MSRPDFLPGNTRLRARIPTLLAPGGVDPATWLATLRAVPPAYAGRAREVVEVVTGRYDLADTLGLLRGALHDHPAPRRLAAVHAVGRMTPELAAEIAHTPDGGAAATRLSRAGLPTPEAASAVAAAWTRFELHGDAEELEADITQAAHAGWSARLAVAGRGARAVEWLLSWERDQHNLGAVLREPPGSEALPRLVDPGRVDLAALTAATAGDLGPVLRARPQWRSAVTGPVTAVRLDHDLRSLLAAHGHRLLRGGDPASADVPVGFVLTLEARAAAARLAVPVPATPT